MPAITVGSNGGGAIQVGTPDVKLSMGSGTAFDRGRIIQSDLNGYGQGIIEVRARQLNIGTNPGINTNRTYPLRVVQNTPGQGGSYGLQIINGNDASANWEFFVTTPSISGGDLYFYYNNLPRGQFDATSGNYSATSDERLKQDIQDLEAVLPKLLALRPKSYQYRGHEGREYAGLLAQELKQVFPDLITATPTREENEESVLLVDYNQLAVLAIKAIQEQQAVITDQQLQIQALEERIERLEKLVLKD